MLYKIKKEDELYRMAFYDGLTGLPNRTLFNRILQETLEDQEDGEVAAVLFLDLDDFKNINDLLGHSVGDKLLVEFVSRIKPLLQNDRYMSRFGGDEFLMVLPHQRDAADVKKKVEEILSTAIGTFRFDEREISTGASIGVALYPEDAKEPEDLIRYADLAMYSAKTNGKNQYVICSEDIKKKFIYEKEIENDLHYAIKNKEFTLYYQPRVSGVSGKIVGVEALLRWSHPQKGMIPPGVFIRIAERIGLMPEIDQWVFREACRQNLYWQRKGFRRISMSVNVTPMTFAENFEGSDILKNLREGIWDPNYLEVEITENTMYFSPESIRNRLKYLRGLGMSVALDDFGIAYSSLGRLHELPIDKIKIDRQFVVNLHEAQKGKNLFDGILNLGRSLGLKINVEGVETKEQAEFVKARGCDEIQGFYYHKPMPPEYVEILLRKEES
jgi:diguanylate cyclase (GGDEF)-like protein